MTKKCDFSLQHGQKEEINFFFQTWFPDEAYFMGAGL